MPRPLSVLVLQHASCEPPGAYEEELTVQRARIHRVEVDLGQPLPPGPDGFDAIIAMGGPMSVNDRDSLDWLNEEIAFITRAVQSDIPLWGVCLGAQLLAKSLGADVVAGPSPEVGLLPIRLTEAALEDSVFGALPDEIMALHWHGDTYTLPAGAVRLAESDAYEQQAFRWSRSYGLQFHVEAGPMSVSEWAHLPEYRRGLESSGSGLTIDGLIADLRAHASTMSDWSRGLMRRWFVDVVMTEPPRRDP